MRFPVTMTVMPGPAAPPVPSIKRDVAKHEGAGLRVRRGRHDEQRDRRESEEGVEAMCHFTLRVCRGPSVMQETARSEKLLHVTTLTARYRRVYGWAASAQFGGRPIHGSAVSQEETSR